MPKETKREKIIRWLKESIGACEVTSPSCKYACVKKVGPEGNPIYYFIGKSGATRCNKYWQITGSWSVSNHVNRLISEGLIQ